MEIMPIKLPYNKEKKYKIREIVSVNLSNGQKIDNIKIIKYNEETGEIINLNIK